jgi:hypothetical protein
MDASVAEAAITISLTDLENLIRRVVHEVVHEELVHLSRTSTLSILDDWSQEGPDDPAGDEELLTDALVMSQQYKESKEGWKSWEDFKAELEQEAETTHALPR